MTSKKKKVAGRKLTFNVVPTPAARPRVTRYRTYYPANYENFRKLMVSMVKKLKVTKETYGPIKVDVLFICKKPKKPKNLWPKGDLDNYEKAILDSLNKYAWKDDSLIVALSSDKVYQWEDHEPCIVVLITPVGRYPDYDMLKKKYRL